MKLTPEQQAVLDGSKGEVMAKVMKTLVMYGDAFGAEKMVPVTSTYGHTVISFGINAMKPVYDLYDQLIEAGAFSEQKFTADPLPLDKNVPSNPLQDLVFHQFMYKQQARYEAQLKKLGILSDKDYTCTCYLDEVGNKPKQGEALIRDGAPVYVIDDAELQRVRESYPCVWKNLNAKPKLCFMGCPHMTLHQLIDTTERVEAGLRAHGQRKVCIPTVFTAAPGVIEEFEKTEYAPRLRNTGVVLSYICPLMYMNNPLSKAMPVITSSNKLRTYTTARYYTEEEIITMITKGAN